MSAVTKIIVKGKIPVDQGAPSNFHVYEENDVVYDACLNQTDIGKNSNKFYNIQLLEADNGNCYCVWTRYGRLGEKGRGSSDNSSSLSLAKIDFEKKFKDKTKNDWSQRKNFRPYAGKYTLIERDFGITDKNITESKPTESKLETKLQDLIRLICDTKMMQRQMVEIGYDANKMPLGKLSKDHIKKGYQVLQQLTEAIEKKEAVLDQLSSQFYTLIPHSFGRSVPPILDTVEKVKQKMEMLDSLEQITVATKLLEENSSIDQQYQKLGCQITPLDKETTEVEMIKKYVKQTHGTTHSDYSLEVQEVFKIDRPGENDRFGAYQTTENRQLLFHGSRLTNFTGILSQGLRIAPPEAPSTGWMFSKGVYFADVVSKSANYCYANYANNTACMLLCEVALGNMNELRQADYHAHNLPNGKLSVKGLGRNIPNPTEAIKLSDGIIVPLGNLQRINIDTSLHYNEYIVYNTAQVKIKYLIKLKFNYN